MHKGRFCRRLQPGSRPAPRLALRSAAGTASARPLPQPCAAARRTRIGGRRWSRYGNRTVQPPSARPGRPIEPVAQARDARPADPAPEGLPVRRGHSLSACPQRRACAQRL